EFSFARLTFHCPNHFTIHHQCADVGASGFLDKLLYDDACLDTVEGFDNRLSGVFVFCQYNAEALGSFQQFDHDGCTTYGFDNTLRIFRIIHEDRLRDAQAGTGQNLKASQLVARTDQGLRFDGGKDLHHLKLAYYRRAVEGYRSADAGDNGIKVIQAPSLVQNYRVFLFNEQHAFHVIDDLHYVPVGLSRLLQTAR